MVSEETPNSRKSMFSPGFKSVAEMAGWDEEALLMASIIVEDTPERSSKHKKRTGLQFITPPSSHSRRKRRAKRSPIAIPVIDLYEEIIKSEERNKKKEVTKSAIKEEEAEVKKPNRDEMNPMLPCMDKLKEELSCAICLEICFEPSTTTCGHSFCQKCLRSAADKCGRRCPKCRQLISNGRSCTVNTVLWNTIQLLFPQEVEARKKSTSDFNTKEPSVSKNPVKETRNSNPRRNTINVRRDDLSRLVPNNNNNSNNNNNGEVVVVSVERRRRGGRGGIRPNQDGDAALALRLQREEFMQGIHGDTSSSSSSFSSARANLRAMASRAVQLRRMG